MKMDAHGATDVENVNEEHFDWHWVKIAATSPQTYFCSLAWFFLLVPLYVSFIYHSCEAARSHMLISLYLLQSFSLFLPTIIKTLGYTSTTAQLYTVPPNMVSFVLVLITSTMSDKIKSRGPIMAAGCVLAMGGYIMLLAAKSSSVRYGGTFLVAAGVYPGSPMVMASWKIYIPILITLYTNEIKGWLSNNLAPHYVRATGLGILIAFANCAAFIATFIYLEKNA
jgi:hypothetical protein